jgi:hypothetical protein
MKANPAILSLVRKVGLSVDEVTPLHANLQRQVRIRADLLTPKYIRQHGELVREVHTLVAVQKDHTGRLVYRAVLTDGGNNFGTILDPAHIVLVD